MKRSLRFAAALAVMALGFATGWVFPASRSQRMSSEAAPSSGRTASAESPAAGEPESRESGAQTSFTARLSELAGVVNPFERARFIDAIADDFNAAEVRDALSSIESSPHPDRKDIRLQLLSRWAELEPEAALNYALQLSSGFVAPGAIETVIKSWAAMDLSAAEEGVKKIRAHLALRVAQKALIEAMAESDPKRAFEMLRSKSPPSGAEVAVIEQWARKNPEEAAAHALLLPSSYWRSAALGSAAERLAEADIERALAWAESLPRSDVPGGTIEQRDPGPLAAILKIWMQADADAAMQWLSQRPEGTEKTDVLAALSRKLAGEQPQRAVELAAMMPDGKTQDAALRSLIRSWGGKDFVGALSWAQQQDSGLREFLLPQLVEQIAWRDTPAAMELALSIGGEAGRGAVSSVLGSWTGKEPLAAAEWAALQPENAPYLASVTRRWVVTDEKSARAWVTALPAGDARDEAVLSAVRYIAQTGEPRRAEQWIAQLKDEKKHADACKELAFWWLRSDSKSAQAWLSSAPLSEDVKAELLNPPAK